MAASRQDISKSELPSLAKDGGLPAWLTDARTVAVMEALEAGTGRARFVGGCVRNTVTGHPVDDIDIATTLEPDQTIAALKAAGLRWIPTGADHGTITAIVRGRPFEITTLRRDVATDGRKATVAFGADWDEDARRRDFRLNTLYADMTGRLYDPTGEGLADARAGKIVFVGDAATRVREDYLRILRFFRFQAWYGRGEPDAQAVAACEALKDGLSGLAAERIAKELLKLLGAPDPRASLALMARTGVLAAVLPEAGDLARLDALVTIEPDADLRLAALLPAGVAKAVAMRLRLSNARRDRLAAAEGQAPEIWAAMSGRDARQALYRIGQGAFMDRVKLAWAAGDPSDAPQWRGLLALAQGWTAPSLPVTGADVAAAGVSKGPVVGAVLRAVEAWWIDNDFVDDGEQALKQMKTVIEGLSK